MILLTMSEVLKYHFWPCDLATAGNYCLEDLLMRCWYHRLFTYKLVTY